MPRREDSTILNVLEEMYPSAWIREMARRCGGRRGKVRIVGLFWTVLLGFGPGQARDLAALQRSFEAEGGTRITPQGFRARFNEVLERLLRGAVQRAMAFLSAQHVAKFSGLLSSLRDVLLLDATVLHLHESLRSLWPGTRKQSPASMKLHVVHSLRQRATLRFRTTKGKTNDRRGWRGFGPWVRGSLLMMDLGYYKHFFFARIEEQGGFFLSRLMGSANPTIVKDNQRLRGRARSLEGRKLREALVGLHRDRLDVQVKVSFKRQKYLGKARKDEKIWRVVGLKHEGTWRLYLTNLPSTLSADAIAELYRLRWQVELLFKTLRSSFRLGDLPVRRPTAVMCLVYASLLTSLISQAIAQRLFPLDEEKDRRPRLLRVAQTMRALSGAIHTRLAERLGLRSSSMSLDDLFRRLAPPPPRAPTTLPERVQTFDFVAVSAFSAP